MWNGAADGKLRHRRFKDTMIAENTINSIQVNLVIEKPIIKNAEAEGNFRKAKFNFIVGLKTLVRKTSVDPKLIQLKICLRNNQKKRALEDISPVFIELNKRSGLQFAGNKIVIPEYLKKQMVETLTFGHSLSMEMLAEKNTFRWSGMRKDNKTSVVHEFWSEY